jgi:hypothetical protein
VYESKNSGRHLLPLSNILTPPLKKKTIKKKHTQTKKQKNNKNKFKTKNKKQNKQVVLIPLNKKSLKIPER